MAQYYKVVSQIDKNSEEIAQYYHNLDDGDTVQYVIAQDGTQQQFQTQQVVVTSSEQLMVVDGQPQQVIVDQSQVAYHQGTPQYIIQETPVSSGEFPANSAPRQVYYMANSPRGPQIMIEQAQQPQPVVLNHQMMQNPTENRIAVGSPMGQVERQIESPEKPQMRVGVNKTQISLNMLPRPLHGTAQRPRVPPGVAAGTSNFQRRSNILERAMKGEQQEFVTLSNGTLVTLEQYQKIVAQQKQNQSVQERLATAALAANSNVKKPNLVRDRPMGKMNPKQPVTMQALKSDIQQRMKNIQNQYIIRPPKAQPAPKPQAALPAFLHSSQMQHILECSSAADEYSDSIRMLVLLENGEQRLITFTLPKEACTIQEILEQVNVPFQGDTPIRVTEANTNGLNYIVTVGNVPGFTPEGLPEETKECPPPKSQGNETRREVETASESSATSTEPSKPSSPEPPKSPPPRYLPGKLAVCSNCGYLSEDFTKCTRCRRKLPDSVKAMSSAYINATNGKKSPLGLAKPNGTPRLNLLTKKRPIKTTRLNDNHPMEAVVISSDEEEDENKTPVKNVSDHIIEKLGTSVSIRPVSKEPCVLDIQKASILDAIRTDKPSMDKIVSTVISCRTVRIGSYKFIPTEPVAINNLSISIKAPHLKLGIYVSVKVVFHDIVKVLMSSHRALPVIFVYTLPSAAAEVRETLGMTKGHDIYFDPLSDTESYRRITLLPEDISEEGKQAICEIFMNKSPPIFDDLTYKEANDILIKTCPKNLIKPASAFSAMSEVKQLMMYPPEGLGRISINTEDYTCLGQDQFLNDVIIDFYLKYLLLNLPKEKQDRVHIFSTFFYKRLTTKPLKASRKNQPTELDPELSPAQKRHSRVKTWTKTVNLFEKDFIIVPINENCHWFLAIICFPGMNGTQTMEGQAIKIEPKLTKKKKEEASAQAEALKKQTESITCEDGDLSDKDEAEGDDSELDSDEAETEVEEPPTLSVENSKRPPIKQPCILIFDSLAGASRSRVVATLRDYLTCEYKAKMDVEKVFTKDVIKGACPKVPQQTNFTDCGLYLLQYVESFFNEPIRDYYMPISHLKNWFEEMTVTKKREDLSLLIKSLMTEYGKDLSLIPDVIFPTLNGEVVERPAENEDLFIDPDEEEAMDEEEDEEFLPAHVLNKTNTSPGAKEVTEGEETVQCSPIKPSSESANGGDFIEQTTLNVSPLKPDVSELVSKPSNRDTLSYLKSKRIDRLKKAGTVVVGVEGPALKKSKTVE